MTNPTPQTLVEPKGIDKALDDIGSKLDSALSWLSNAYGRAERLEEDRDGIRYNYPGVYVGGVDYLNVHPDEHLENHSFFMVADRNATRVQGDFIGGDCDVRLIVWFDYREVYPADHESRSIENVIIDVLEALKSIRGVGYRFEVTGVMRDGAQYEGYDLTLQQPLMRPYGGFAVNLNVQYWEEC